VTTRRTFLTQAAIGAFALSAAPRALGAAGNAGACGGAAPAARPIDGPSGIKVAIDAWEKSAGPALASIGNVADHIDHIRKTAGIDHIGIGADFYHADTSDMVTGLGDVTRYPYLFAELLRRGYSDEDVLKIAGRNHLRAMRAMEKVAADLQRTESPLITEGVKH